MLFSLFLFPASFLQRDHRRLAALGTVHAPGVVRQNDNGIVIAVGTARDFSIVYPGAADGEAVVATIQREKRHFGLAPPHADAGFLVLAELALETDKTSHGSPSSTWFFMKLAGRHEEPGGARTSVGSF